MSKYNIIIMFFLFIVWDSISLDNPYYFKPQMNDRGKLLREISVKRGLKTLDLSNLSCVEDGVVESISKATCLHSLINIDLSQTKITKNSLEYILNGDCGTVREFIKYNKEYGLPVSEVFIDSTGSYVTNDDIKQFKTPVKKTLIFTKASEDGKLFKIPGIKIIIIRNEPIPSLRDNLPLKVLRYSPSQRSYFSQPEMMSNVVAIARSKVLNNAGEISSQNQRIIREEREKIDVELPWFEIIEKQKSRIESYEREIITQRYEIEEQKSRIASYEREIITQRYEIEEQKSRIASYEREINAQRSMIESMSDSLKSFDFNNLFIPLRNDDVVGLFIRNNPLNTTYQDIFYEDQKFHLINDRREFKLQDVSGMYMSFFNAAGLEYYRTIEKLKTRYDDPIVRYMISNEIIWAVQNQQKLSERVKEAIKYELYEEQRNKLKRDKREILCQVHTEQRNDFNEETMHYAQDSNVEQQKLLAIKQKKKHLQEDLRRMAFSLEAFIATIFDYKSENTMVALHDMYDGELDNKNENYTLIDAVSYISNIGIKVYQSNELDLTRLSKLSLAENLTPNLFSRNLRLTHQFIPQGATEVSYLYHRNGHFQAFVL